MDEQTRIKKAVGRILDWYAAVRRPLPWREAPSPYQVWISEIMLQQTRIQTVLPYYARFLRELPDVSALAEVEEDRLLKLWEGLGYYSRARNLRKAARKLCAEHGGELPRTAAELRALPGVGDYTAGAIASIAFGEPEPAVDGNVLRVLMRVLACGDDITQPGTRRRATRLLRAHYPRGKEAGLLTEGLMELGETVCLPNGAPACASCPLRELCLAGERGEAERYPVKAAPKPRRVEARTVLLLCCGGRWAVRQRPETGLLARMWEFPSVKGTLDAGQAAAAAEDFGAKSLACEPVGEAVHVFTHVEWHMTGYAVALDRPAAGLVWKTAEELRRDCPIPTALRVYLEKIEQTPMRRV